MNRYWVYLKGWDCPMLIKANHTERYRNDYYGVDQINFLIKGVGIVVIIDFDQIRKMTFERV